MSSATFCRDCGKSLSIRSGFSHEDCREYPSKRDPDHAMTFEEIGAELKITRQRVEQIYTKAIAKMRRAIEKENRK